MKRSGANGDKLDLSEDFSRLVENYLDEGIIRSKHGGPGFFRQVDAPGKNKKNRKDPDLVLDLHGLTISQALDRCEEGIVEARRRGVRSIRIIHGKGHHSPAGPVLKREISDYLKSHMQVKEWISAPPRLGGDGALIIKIR